MSYAMRVSFLVAAAAGCLMWCTSCGNGSRAVAAPAIQLPGAITHRARLLYADGREDQMEIIGWNHEVVSPRDAASGLPTGKRQHKPVTIIKPVDASSPGMMRSLLDETVIDRVTIESERSGYGGSREVYLKIEMEKVSIVGSLWARPEGLAGTSDPEVVEATSFDYEKIIWTWAGGTTAEDVWVPAR